MKHLNYLPSLRIKQTLRCWLLMAAFAAFSISYAQAQGCSPTNVPFTQDFESVTPPNLPSCATDTAFSGNSWATASSGSSGFSGNVLRYKYDSDNANSWYYTQGINLQAGTQYMISYKYGNNSTFFTESLDVYYGTSADTTAMQGNQLADYPSINSDAAVQEDIFFTVPADGVYHFGFHAYSVSGQWNLYVDDIEIKVAPTCFKPDNLTMDAVTANSATVSWSPQDTETQWDIVYGNPGFDPDTAQVTTVNDSTHTLTGLAAQTTYDVYVRARCSSSDQSAWSGPLSVTTACATHTAPFSEDFAASSTPLCWTESGDNSWDYSTNADYAAQNAGDHTSGGGGNYAWVDGSVNTDGDTTNLISPLVDVSSLTTPALEFYLFSDNTDDAAINIIDVDFYDGATWHNVLHVNQLLGNTWNYYIFDLSSYSISGPVKVRFSVVGDDSNGGSTYHNDILVDDVSFKELPTCIKPSNLAVSNVTYNSADISWTAGGSETQWQVVYDTAGFAPNSATPTLVSDSSTVLSGLQASTSYEVYVRAYCSTTDQSTWVGPVSFTTACASMSLPFNEDFAGSTTPNCWTESGDNSWDYSTGADYAAQNAGDHTPGGGTNYAWMDGSDNEPGMVSSLTSPFVDVSTLTVPAVEFYLFSDNTDDNLVNIIDVDIFDGANWHNALHIDSLLGSSWTHHLIDLSTYTITGPVSVRFTITGGDESGGGQTYNNDILIDDVSFIESPNACPAPSGLATSNITNDSVDISWTAGGSETQWQVVYDTAGFAPNTATPTLVSNTTTTLSGLQANTTYDVYVRAYCSASNQSTWVGPVSFTTTAPAPCIAPTNLGAVYTDITSAKVDWTPANATDDMWAVVYGLQGFVVANALDTLIVTSADAVISGLNPATSYDVYVVTVCDSASLDISTPTGPLTITTLACDAPTNIVIDSITTSSAQVSWTAGGAETQWEVVYDTAGFNPSTATPTMVSDTTIDLNGLQANTTYEVYVRAYCSASDQSAWTGPVSFTTAAPPCLAPTNISIDSIAATAAIVSWTAGGTETQWNVIYGQTGFTLGNGGDTVVVNNTTVVTLTNLNPETDYDVYVEAVCAPNNTSGTTGPETFTTQPLGVNNPVFDSFTYYPNPVKGQLNLEAHKQIESVTVYNLLGQQIIHVQPHALQTQVNLENLESAVYLMEVQINGAVKTFRIVKQ